MGSKHGSLGKWSCVGVPHKGWNCIGGDDVGDDMILCGMCEAARVRFVHYMEHEDYPERLSVGCICAGKMEEDQGAAEKREAYLRRQRGWLNREWRTSAKGNEYINTEGFNIVVMPAAGRRWKVVITNRETGAYQPSKSPYGSVRDAKLGALKGLIWARENL